MDELTSKSEVRSRFDLPGGWTLRGIASIAAAALAIIGLCGVAPVLLMSIASIFLGIALLISAGDSTVHYSRGLTGVETAEDVTGAMGFDALAGLAGIILGILALIGVAPHILLPSAAITFGCAMLLESISATAGGIDLLCGAAAVVLGILALSGYSPAVLTFVAFLTVGFANLLTGTSLLQRTSAAINRKF